MNNQKDSSGKPIKTDMEPWKTNLELWKTMKTNPGLYRVVTGGTGDSKEEVLIFVTDRQTKTSSWYIFNHHHHGSHVLLFHLLLLWYQLMFLLYSFNVHADLFHIGLTMQRLNWARRKIPRGKQKKEKTMRRKNDIKEKMTYLLFLLNTSLDLGRTVDGSAGGQNNITR